MRVINSGDVKKLLDDKADPGELFDFDEDIKSPCWEAKVDRENGKLVFFIDREEILSAPLNNFKESEITVERLSYFIQLLKNGEYERLAEETNK